MSDLDRTAELIDRCHQGSDDAVAELLERDLAWIRSFVRRRLGPLLKQRGQTIDYVQDVMVEALRYGPRFRVTGKDQFRALLARIIENMLRDRAEWHGAQKRHPQREQPLPSGSVLDLDGGVREVTKPSEAAARHEARDWVRLAIELLSPEDRKVVLLREWQGLSFADIGTELGLSENTARMRFQRALPRLAELVAAIRAGKLEDVLREPRGGA